MLNFDNPEIKFAIDAVRQATMLVREVQSELAAPALTKDDRSPVTVADFASQALIGYLLQEHFPDDPLVAEEDSSTLREPASAAALEKVCDFAGRYTPSADSDLILGWIDHARADSASRFWTLDPIDGTKGFLRGEQYAVALALVEEGQVKVGALGCPNLVDAYRPDEDSTGSLVIAVRGAGTWVTSLVSPGEYERLHVSQRTDPAEARILRSVEAGHTDAGLIDVFSRELGTKSAPVLMDSQAKYAVLAAGKGDILLRLLSPSRPDYKEKIWDQAAGSLVLEEAGGRITDLDGRPLDFTQGRTLKHNRGVVATNGHLHAAAIETLKRIGA